MSSSTSKAVSSLARYRPAILALTAIAAGFTIYAISNRLPLFPAGIPDASKPSSGSLHRSNAQRRRLTRRRPIPVGTELQSEAAPELGVIIHYGEKYYRGRRVFGTYQYTNAANGERHVVWLAPHQLPSIQRMQDEWNIGVEEASSLRWHMEIKLLDSFFAQELPPEPPIPLTERAREGFSIEFAAAAQIPPSIVSSAIERYQVGNLQNHPARSTRGIDSDQPRPAQLSISSSDEVPPGTPGDLSAMFRIFHDSVIGEARNVEHHIAETESIQSDEVGGDDQNKAPDDQNVMNLLYRIAEDQAKKEGFVHRGVNCNSCNAMPICGIRWRCSNCPDYDLCEQCDSMQIHDKTHIFYRVRIPAPLQSNPRQAAPVWYPGNPGKVCRNLTTELKMMLSTKTGIPERQVDAVWEQFQCLASGDFLDDPCGFCIAINRRDFNKCFVPSAAQGTPPANLIYDRTFSFYDTNNDGLVGFEELLNGIACIANRGSKLRAKIFRSYDLDGDGFVTRKDFLRMFRAYYAMTKELTTQVISGNDDEFFDEADAREIIGSSQPISSIFSGPIPSGDPSRTGMGKSMDRDGDMHVVDGQGFLLENGTADHVPGSDVGVGRDVIYQVTEEAMNELLDPMFKLREDFAIEIKKTGGERRLYKDVIDRCMSDGFDQTILDIFQFYQKRWYQDSRDTELVNMALADNFVKFVLKALKEPRKFQEFFPDATVNMDLAVGKEEPGEVSHGSAGSKHATSVSLTGKAAGDEVALELHEGTGYGVAIQDFDWSPASSIFSLDDEQKHLDPTMPQYRPNSTEEPPKTKGLPLLSKDKLLTLTLWTVIEEDDMKRGGPGRLNLTDYTHIMEGDKGEGLGFVGSWIETAVILA
ncbi:MAG: hypothetical protein L6R38_001469 [Xanthoria sp. 2 TBL-2021]|nr:MAG: hypothetical protein L6R38_001469 [Xanthoria sp. 2 TBL-2021]